MGQRLSTEAEGKPDGQLFQGLRSPGASQTVKKILFHCKYRWHNWLYVEIEVVGTVAYLRAVITHVGGFLTFAESGSKVLKDNTWNSA